MGIKTVAVYSTADKDSLHVKFADEAVCIGGPKSAESYLNIPHIMAACEITNADAVHPGYGFLAENAKFAQICADHGIKFIGPTPEMINKMGDKITAKDTMIKAGVPVVPGGKGLLESVEEAVVLAKEIGYPVILKATAGGGGKGMRVVWSEEELERNYDMAKNEAGASFKNDGIYLEKFVEEPRHIEIQIAGEKASIHSFQDARKYGIGMVFQEFSLVPELSVAQNIFLDREHKNRFHLFDEKETIRQSKLVMEELGLNIDVTAKVSTLGRAFQQLTEIAKAIAGDAKILILDEPTASLAKEEVDALFKVLKQLTARGVSIVYISHRMDEIYRICDRITILRDGKKIAVSLLSEISPQEIIAHITGRKDVEMLTHEGKSIARSSTPIFEASGIQVGNRVNNVSFKLYPGEILGLAGLMGSGRTELVRAIFGLDKKDGGALKIDGKDVVIKNPRDAIAHGFALIPEDRRRQGLARCLRLPRPRWRRLPRASGRPTAAAGKTHYVNR